MDEEHRLAPVPQPEEVQQVPRLRGGDVEGVHHMEVGLEERARGQLDGGTTSWTSCTSYLSHFGAESHLQSLDADLHGQHVVVTGGSSGSVRHPT